MQSIWLYYIIFYSKMQSYCLHLSFFWLSIACKIPDIIYVVEVIRMKNKNFDVWLGIGLNILHYRKEQGMTQIQLAEKCDISRTYMQKIETAACSCTLDTLIDIADALNIPLKKLFEFKDWKTYSVMNRSFSLSAQILHKSSFSRFSIDIPPHSCYHRLTKIQGRYNKYERIDEKALHPRRCMGWCAKNIR